VLLLCLLVAAQSPVVRPQYDLASYLAVAAQYRSSDRETARREIREWRIAELEAAIRALRKAESRLRAIPVQATDIDFRTVEAAVLMHAEVGLVFLQALSPVEAQVHLETSLRLFEWSRSAASRPRERPSRRETPPVEPRIDGRDYYLAMAAALLGMGFPNLARTFAEEAIRAAPMDAEVRLLSGCLAASLAEEASLRHEGADGQLEDAERFLRDALALDPGLLEARLRLGKLLLDERRTIEAEPLLAEVDARTADDRQRYLARLFLGRVADRRGRPEEAVRSYRRALESWPDSQAARLALAHALEKSSGPAVPPVLVGATLSASRRLVRAPDPWWQYPFGPPGLAMAALDRVWNRTLDQ
jgi:tetratricopeptide (TPR) repeat protein